MQISMTFLSLILTQIPQTLTDYFAYLVCRDYTDKVKGVCLLVDVANNTEQTQANTNYDKQSFIIASRVIIIGDCDPYHSMNIATNNRRKLRMSDTLFQ